MLIMAESQSRAYTKLELCSTYHETVPEHFCVVVGVAAWPRLKRAIDSGGDDAIAEVLSC